MLRSLSCRPLLLYYTYIHGPMTKNVFCVGPITAVLRRMCFVCVLLSVALILCYRQSAVRTGWWELGGSRPYVFFSCLRGDYQVPYFRSHKTPHPPNRFFNSTITVHSTAERDGAEKCFGVGSISVEICPKTNRGV